MAADLSATHSYSKSSTLLHPKGAHLDSDLETRQELIVMFMDPLWDSLGETVSTLTSDSYLS